MVDVIIIVIALFLTQCACCVEISVSIRIAYDAYYVMYYGKDRYTKKLAYPEFNERPYMPPDRFVKGQRQDLVNLMADMLKEAMRTRRKMEKVRRVHHKQLPYQIGFILGIIRETYSRMMNMYQQAKNRYLNKDPYLMPTMFYGIFVNLEYYMIMEDIHYGELKINRLVDLIEQTSFSNFEVEYVLRRSRQKDEEAEDILQRMEKMEVAYKQEVRRQYRLHRRLMPINGTRLQPRRRRLRRRNQRQQTMKGDTWGDYEGGQPVSPP